MDYVAPRWLPGGNLQTIWPALYARRAEAPLPAYRRERWNTPDGDFVDVDFLDAALPGPKPLLVLFHGLEGSSKSHYAEVFGAFAHARGWDYAVPHFRGCSGELNLAPRAYHSGDFEEIGWILARLRAQRDPAQPLLAAGVSLGGNALMRWAEEAGAEASKLASAATSGCARTPRTVISSSAMAPLLSTSRRRPRIWANIRKTLSTGLSRPLLASERNPAK